MISRTLGTVLAFLGIFGFLFFTLGALIIMNPFLESDDPTALMLVKAYLSGLALIGFSIPCIVAPVVYFCKGESLTSSHKSEAISWEIKKSLKEIKENLDGHSLRGGGSVRRRSRNKR